MSAPQYMAVDQYGQTYWNLHHPRKELLEKFYRQHADAMYQDFKNGSTKRVGYIISGHWLTVLGIEGAKFAKEV